MLFLEHTNPETFVSHSKAPSVPCARRPLGCSFLFTGYNNFWFYEIKFFAAGNGKKLSAPLIGTLKMKICSIVWKNGAGEYQQCRWNRSFRRSGVVLAEEGLPRPLCSIFPLEIWPSEIPNLSEFPFPLQFITLNIEPLLEDMLYYSMSDGQVATWTPGLFWKWNGKEKGVTFSSCWLPSARQPQTELTPKRITTFAWIVHFCRLFTDSFVSTFETIEKFLILAVVLVTLKADWIKATWWNCGGQNEYYQSTDDLSLCYNHNKF